MDAQNAPSSSDVTSTCHDIANQFDIHLLVNCFYKKVFANELLAPFFTNLDEDRWANHLKIMYGFWENVLFFTGGYFGNPIESHKKIHQHMPLNKEHFDVWLWLFVETVNENFEGEKAELAKRRAKSLAVVMEIKICRYTSQG